MRLIQGRNNVTSWLNEVKNEGCGLNRDHANRVVVKTTPLPLGQAAEQEFERISPGLPQKLQNQIPGLSRTFLGHFPGLFQDCLRFLLHVLKFNFPY